MATLVTKLNFDPAGTRIRLAHQRLAVAYKREKRRDGADCGAKRWQDALYESGMLCGFGQDAGQCGGLGKRVGGDRQ